MTNGSTLLEGYTPEVDATVVTRILDAGMIVFLHMVFSEDRAVTCCLVIEQNRTLFKFQKAYKPTRT